MGDEFKYGRCVPWRATISTEFCGLYRASGKDKCQTCEGLIMDSATDNVTETKTAAPADHRLAFQDYLKTLMTAKSAGAKDVAKAVGCSAFPVYKWLSGETFPTVAQAGRLNEFFGSTLTADYKALLRKDFICKDRGDKDVKINKAVKPNAAAPKPKPEQEPEPSNTSVDVLKGTARLEKRIMDAADQAHQAVYGDAEPGEAVDDSEAIDDSETVTVDGNDRQMALAILLKVLECLSLLFKGQNENSAV